MKDPAELLKQITVNTHSSVRIEAAGKAVYIDPFGLQNAPRDADVIFLTHSHFDHFSPEDVEKTGRPGTVFVMPKTMVREAAKAVKGRPVVETEPFARGEAAGIPFEAVPAYNPHKPFHPRANNWVGYVLTVEGLRVYIAGDTDATPEAAAVNCDLALLPIGGKYTMDPEQAAELANRIRPQIVIPIHYGSVAGSPADFTRFAAKVDPAVRVEAKL